MSGWGIYPQPCSFNALHACHTSLSCISSKEPTLLPSSPFYSIFLIFPSLHLQVPSLSSKRTQGNPPSSLQLKKSFIGNKARNHPPHTRIISKNHSHYAHHLCDCIILSQKTLLSVLASQKPSSSLLISREIHSNAKFLLLAQ